MTARLKGASRVHLGVVVQVLPGPPVTLMVEVADLAVGFRLGPLRAAQGPGVGGAAAWALGDAVVVAELTPTDKGYVVLGRLA